MRRAWVLALVAGSMVACGGGSSPTSSTSSSTPAVPAAVIQATGNGAMEVHPSAVPQFGWAFYVPIRITETAGGTAKWNYVRMSLLQGGVELERSEIGADTLAEPPDWTNITARQNAAYALVFRFNDFENFDDMSLELGFSDKKDGRQFVVPIVSSQGFTGPDVVLTPLARPAPGVERIE